MVEEESFTRIVISTNHGPEIPSCNTIRRRILAREEDYRVKMKALLRKRRRKVSLTADAWSLQTYRVDMIVTAHWIDLDWLLRSALLEFRRLLTTPTGGAACSLIKEVILAMELQKDVMTITTDNASNMVTGMSKLCRGVHELVPGRCN